MACGSLEARGFLIFSHFRVQPFFFHFVFVLSYFSFDVIEEEDSTAWGACGGTGLRSQVSREAAFDCRNAQKVQSSTLPFHVFTKPIFVFSFST